MGKLSNFRPHPNDFIRGFECGRPCAGDPWRDTPIPGPNVSRFVPAIPDIGSRFSPERVPLNRSTHPEMVLREDSTTNHTNLTNENGKVGYRVILASYDHDELVWR